MHPCANIGVVHNGLSQRWLDAASSFESARSDYRKIGYFPGTRSHDHDLQLIVRQLADYVNRHGDTSFLLAGSIDMPDEAFQAHKVIRCPHRDYMDLSELLLQCWVTIAPLQNNRFNQCKSGLKFFESAAFGIPVIATPIPDMRRFEGSNFFPAETPEDFLFALEALRESELYRTTSQNMRHYALEHCMSMHQTKKLLEFVGEANGMDLQVVSCGF